MRWTSQTKQLRIGLKNVDLQAFFNSHGLRTVEIEGPWLNKAVNNDDVVIADVLNAG